MRQFRFVVAIVALSVAAAPVALAQGRQAKEPQETVEQRNARTQRKLDERAYKAAMDRTPVSEKKYDPWEKMR